MNLTPAALDRLNALFRHFAKLECPEEPLYEALCHLVADDATLMDLLSGASPEQQRPNLWLAAVHDLLLAGAAHPLAEYYPSVGGRRLPDAALHDCVRDFAVQHETALRGLMATRSTQTNEVGRCAVLWPALHAIAGRAGRAEMALLDVGTSAGLNLGVDTFAYEERDAQPGVPLLPCEQRGALRPPRSPRPQLVRRCGIDPAPVPLDDEGALRWLQACLWPSDSVRATRFQQAVRIAREHRWPVMKVDDCTGYVEQWLAALPAGVQPVIFNSWVLTYFEPAALKRHIAVLADLVARTGAMWLSAESSLLRVGPVDVPLPLPGQPAVHSLWTLCSRVDGQARFEALARSHAHGRWMEWLDAR